MISSGRLSCSSSLTLCALVVVVLDGFGMLSDGPARPSERLELNLS